MATFHTKQKSGWRLVSDGIQALLGIAMLMLALVNGPVLHDYPKATFELVLGLWMLRGKP